MALPHGWGCWLAWFGNSWAYKSFVLRFKSSLGTADMRNVATVICLAGTWYQ
jgi:hypothetical protein